jgi:hypothetical protein
MRAHYHCVLPISHSGACQGAEAREAARLREAQPYASKEWDLAYAEIDRLRAEVAQLERQVDAVGAFYNTERERVELLRAEITRLREEKQDFDETWKQLLQVICDNGELRAEIARLKAQNAKEFGDHTIARLKYDSKKETS